ncbi:ComEA family DNA-binding protein [uncultured Clostridium sp.]|uniref:ComEA family DNA-binding protein n=1 Tax=uncultured Clostridium sp. TaxID=59620 RepID=UPI0026390FA3|nr:ComEA family DNA-binding protein [uncultured Clostridium sp.]
MINMEKLDKYKKTIGISVVLVVLIVATMIYLNREEKGKLGTNKSSIFIEENEEEKDVIQNEKEKKKILVDIKGEVKNPGVYELEEGSIIEHLIKEAGGLTKEGTLENINRAKELKGNEAIVICSKKELEVKAVVNNGANNVTSGAGNMLEEAESNDSGKININTGTVDDLKKLNGIGEGKAKAIIEYREKNGEFKNPEEIQKVSGIGKGTFEKIKEDIGV